MIRPIRSIAVAIGLAAMLATLPLPATASGPGTDKGTWRCTGADGKVLFTNGNCPAGTVKARPWAPAPVGQGIERTGPGQGAPLAANQPPLEPLLPTGRVDPFVDCKARGGEFDLAARVCHLPPGGTRSWRSADD